MRENTASPTRDSASPPAWSYTTLGEVCDIVMGQSPPSSTYNTDGDGLPFFQGAADFGDMYPRTRVYCNDPARIAEKGDILISVRAPVGPTNRAPARSCIGRGVAALRPGAQLDVLYLLYFLRHQEGRLAHLGQGSTFDAIGRDDIEEYPIPLPPLSDQRRIAGILDQADRLRRMRRYALELSDQFLPALFLRMFGDPRTDPLAFDAVPAGELFDIQLGKMLDEKRYTGKHLRPYLGNANVQWGRFDLAGVKMMDFPPEDFERFRLRAGDIVVCEGGEVGRTAIWRGEISDCCYQKAVHRLRLKSEEIRPIYFQWFMWSAVREGLVAKETSTSTIGHFTAERFNDFPVMLPPLGLQDHFVDTASENGRLAEAHREAQRQAEHLFQSLLQRYFGEAG